MVITTIKDLQAWYDSPEGKKTMAAYNKALKAVMRTFHVDEDEARYLIDEATEYDPRNQKELISIIREFIKAEKRAALREMREKEKW